MILHGFAWRSSKNKILRPQSLTNNEQIPNKFQYQFDLRFDTEYISCSDTINNNFKQNMAAHRYPIRKGKYEALSKKELAIAIEIDNEEVSMLNSE